ncbi:unnamed protein product [Haemonchus placei]|uniref:Uncharacterized protein n=1 Tax=Haemonchus placei TaxID=6290 RepID=A0A0N4VU58_HAEPC|nr:unnamed protein product [Haemonchus placei]
MCGDHVDDNMRISMTCQGTDYRLDAAPISAAILGTVRGPPVEMVPFNGDQHRCHAVHSRRAHWISSQTGWVLVSNTLTLVLFRYIHCPGLAQAPCTGPSLHHMNAFPFLFDTTHCPELIRYGYLELQHRSIFSKSVRSDCDLLSETGQSTIDGIAITINRQLVHNHPTQRTLQRHTLVRTGSLEVAVPTAQQYAVAYPSMSDPIGDRGYAYSSVGSTFPLYLRQQVQIGHVVHNGTPCDQLLQPL